MTTNDVVGWLVWGLDEKWALRLGLFLLLPPAIVLKKQSFTVYMYMYNY